MYHLVVIIKQNTSRAILSENLESQCGCSDRVARVLQTLAVSSGRMSFAITGGSVYEPYMYCNRRVGVHMFFLIFIKEFHNYVFIF